jgi:hypothetical protein
MFEEMLIESIIPVLASYDDVRSLTGARPDVGGSSTRIHCSSGGNSGPSLPVQHIVKSDHTIQEIDVLAVAEHLRPRHRQRALLTLEQSLKILFKVNRRRLAVSGEMTRSKKLLKKIFELSPVIHKLEVDSQALKSHE